MPETISQELLRNKKSESRNEKIISIETRRKLFSNLKKLFRLYGITSDCDIVILLYTQYLFNKTQPCIAYQIANKINEYTHITGLSCDRKTIYNRLNKLTDCKFFIKPIKKMQKKEYRKGNPYIPLPLDKLIDTLSQIKLFECEMRVQNLKKKRALQGYDVLQDQVNFLVSGDVAKIFMYRELLFWKEKKNIDSMRLGDLKCIGRLRKMGKKDDAIIRIVKYLMKNHLVEETSPINFNTQLTPIAVYDALTIKMKEIIEETKMFYETYPIQRILRQGSISIEVINIIFDEGNKK